MRFSQATECKFEFEVIINTLISVFLEVFWLMEVLFLYHEKACQQERDVTSI